MLKRFLLSLLIIGLLGSVAQANESAEAQASAKDNGPQYVKISPIILPLVGEQGVEQIISLIVAIEVPDRQTADKVIVLSPKLNDAYLTDLYGSIDRRDSFRNGLVDVRRIKDRIEKASIRILGQEHVKSVLVQAVMQRPA